MINLDKYVSSKHKQVDVFDLLYVLAEVFKYTEDDIARSSVPFLLGLFNKHVERLKAEQKAYEKNKNKKGK